MKLLSIDDLLKVVLIFAVAFAIVGISYELMKLIGKLTQVLEDLRHPINNASELTDYALEDYVDARSVVRKGLSDLSSFKGIIENPVMIGSIFFKVISKIKEMLGRKEK